MEIESFTGATAEDLVEGGVEGGREERGDFSCGEDGNLEELVELGVQVDVNNSVLDEGRNERSLDSSEFKS
jgi:hypothetical protein